MCSLSFIRITFLGYGSFAPLSDAGKAFCIFFGFFGIPFCGLLLAKTGGYFSSILLSLYEKRRKKDENCHGILTAAAVFLLPGLALFLFVPAVIFSYIEVIVSALAIQILRLLIYKESHNRDGHIWTAFTFLSLR